MYGCDGPRMCKLIRDAGLGEFDLSPRYSKDSG